MRLRRRPSILRPSAFTFLIIALACTLPALGADLASASQAYKAGDFDTARVGFLDLAALGEPRAQFNLGAMALRGEGTSKDEGVAAGWMRAASQNGHQGIAESQLQLLEAGLSSRGQEAAAAIIADYGRETLNARVLPARPPFRCKQRYVPPRVVQISQPLYPIGELRDRRDGIVILQFTVGLDGLARDPEVLGAAPIEKFDRAAIRAILASRFQPATLDGSPLESRAELRYTFMLREGGDLWSVSGIQRARESAAAGSPSAQYLIGLLGTLDPSLKIPVDDARKMLLASAQAGMPEAQYWIGSHLRNESYCSGTNKMQPWLRQAAKSDLSTARIAFVREALAHPETASSIEELRTLVHATAGANDAYSVKHATALLIAPPLADAALALTAAKKLADMDADYDPQVSEVIAAAHAANQDFRQAIRHQERALGTAEDLHWNVSVMRERLAAYQSSQTWSGDLFALPPATGVLPEVDNPNRGCGRDNAKCERTPDRKRAPIGSTIPR
jgi:TonB family protein